MEECSLTRSSVRLALGQSAVSTRIKAIEDELGQQLFSRMRNGMVATSAGLRAYAKLRPLIARAIFCSNFVRSQSRQSPRFVNLAVLANHPGALLEEALEATKRRLAGQAPETCLLIEGNSGAIEGKRSITVSYGSPAILGASAVRDRWVLLRAGRLTGWREGCLTVADLATQAVTISRLPPPLLDLASSLASRAGMRLTPLDIEPNELPSKTAQFPALIAILPASLITGPILRHFDCISLEPTPFDPNLRINGDAHPEVVALLHETLSASLQSMRRGEPLTPAIVGPEWEVISLKHSRSFLALYEIGNVGRAARQLCIVQPALTVQLHALEQQLGLRLFGRDCHGLQPNAHSDRLYELLQPLVADFDATMRDLRAGPASLPRRVRIGLMPALDDESLTAESFATALGKWTERHPDHVAEVVEAYSSKLLRWLHTGRVDFAVIDFAVSDPGLLIDHLASDCMAVVVGAGSELLEPGPVTLEQVAKLPLVLPSSRHGLRTLMMQQFKDKGLSVKPRIEVDSMVTALSLVKIAPFATILPIGSVYKSSYRRELTVHVISEPRVMRMVCLARAARDPFGPHMLDFIEELHFAFGTAAPPLARFTSEARACSGSKESGRKVSPQLGA